MAEDLLEGLNESQKKAVMHDRGPLLIVAGAGTGKTRVLTTRYAYLLQNGKLTTENILALTFTEKAAAEMEDRVLQLLPTGAYDFWISTFHGFCQRVLEAHALEIGLPNRFRILTETDAWMLLRRHLDELPLDHYRPLGNPTKFLAALLKHISRAKDECVTPERYLDFALNATLDGDSEEIITGERKRLKELADLYFVYRKLMLDNGFLDFGDLILETLRLFRERPAILEQYRKQFHYIMVDEFQDTNWAQYELLKLLAGQEKNLTVVGDDDQAIYKFRGASLANILQFKDDFPDAATVALNDNYRSHGEILERAYSFIQKNDPNRLEVKLKDTGLNKKLCATRGTGGEVCVLWSQTAEEEADAVIADILRRKSADPGSSWNDFAILSRSNDGAEPFVAACERQQIPFQFLALRGLYAKPVILDTFAILSVVNDRHDSTAVWRLLSLPCYGLSSADAAELLHQADRLGVSLWHVLKDAALGHPEIKISEEGRGIANRIVQNIEASAEHGQRLSPLRALHAVLDKTGYLAAMLKTREESDRLDPSLSPNLTPALSLRLPAGRQVRRGRTEEQRQEDINHLNAFAARVRRYEGATYNPSLKGFIEEFKLELDSGEEGALSFDPDAGPEFVRIMTIHGAKGLEFNHVYIVSLVDQRFPTRERKEAIALPDGLVQERLPEGNPHLEEERRLFYVALTRARDSLTLTGAFDYGGAREKKPSVFLAEAGMNIPIVKPQLSLQPPPAPPYQGESFGTLPDKGGKGWVSDLKRRFSFTQLAAFRKCPLQYKLAHIYRIPILGSFQKSFGQSLHAAFQRMLALHQMRASVEQVSLFAGPSSSSSGFRVTEKEAQKIFEETWIDEWYENRKQHDEHLEQGRKAVRNFWRACCERVPDVLEVEKDFLLQFGQHSLKGKIDRVDRLEDGSVAIIDYKTGRAKEKLETEDKEQLWLYQIALENRGLKVGKLAYQYVIDWITTEVEPLTGQKREDFLSKIEERMQAILSSNFEATPDPFTCNYCDFKNFCEFRKL